MTGRGRAARQRRLDTGVVETIPAVAADGGDVAMPLREAFEYYGTARGAVPNYVNAFAVESYEQPGVDSQEAAKRLAVPFRLVFRPLARRLRIGGSTGGLIIIGLAIKLAVTGRKD